MKPLCKLSGMWRDRSIAVIKSARGVDMMLAQCLKCSADRPVSSEDLSEFSMTGQVMLRYLFLVSRNHQHRMYRGTPHRICQSQ